MSTSIMCLAMASCNGLYSSGSGDLKDQIIVPRSSDSIHLYGESRHSAANPDGAESGTLTETKAVLPDDFLVQATFDLNLDMDTAMEQVVVFKTTSGAGNLLNLGIIDFDTERNSYFLAQSLPALSINIRTFTLRVLDLTRDNVPELVASGLDAEGKQTLDVFILDSQEGTESNEPIQYHPGINISADISIELRKQEPSVGEDAEGSEYLPYYEIYVQNRSSINTIDMTEDIYTWNSSRKIFQMTSSHVIPGKEVQEAQLKDLQNATTEDFEKFISGESGAWYRNIKDKRGQSYMQLVFFEPEARSVRLIEGDRMESYIWKASTNPSVGTRLQIFLQNESFHILRSMATIIPNSSNEMTFYLQDKNEWSGTFYRLSAEQEQEMKLGQYRTSMQINPLILSGLFKSESGGEIVFSAPWFTWRQGEKQKKGGYITYQLNQTVLELQSISDKGLVEEKECYIIKVVKNDDGSLPQYELSPAVLTINGVTPKGSEVIRIIQISTESN